ncbi:WecB/TagA/CpsF family glycosyltransferase [Echinicola vietnamensis]|uniref:Exopolysaccharide biosynthesis protein, WecB/TagA/CpsF family n=1 Tax=Echinicola vietnamensis (strain DSM 17526 / LMG 23754 / KMM 6221) TaxID=926556 RepID=L0G3D0_ECHVK|nr:WecB/TagA/CpsF family glycosyltransferase [Echinicola vietnamensis]AGA80002.1 exopolysaccharide biosynthesis protein, WecB/TagA/CpsF family [Echinicola vietnamensis DSM 17526]
MAYKLLGTEVDDFNLSSLLDFIVRSARAKERNIILSQNLHGIYTYHKSNSEQLKRLYSIAKKRIDGMPLVWLGKALGYPLSKDNRLTWVDLMDPLMERVRDEKLKVFYLGADEVSVSKGVNILRDKFSGLEITYRHGYFDTNKRSQENQAVVQLINAYAPDILIVGMGMPRQEHWILDNKDELNASVIMTCGAAIEYVAGTVSTPPRWMGRTGLEWLYRLQEDPNRFWFRYLIEPWYIFRLAASDLRNPPLKKLKT